ncbi:3-hydroxybutyrate dehydrogenase [Inquilinus sp. CAU 1745]|uniref:3-hydroxybutyrate dehydrogenase n=1 Tax=Inquilinus sp. CAU 1745 TaxID=3140369 RepID=UPI00325BE0EA
MLKGKVALVTGSTSGIGLGIARSLAEAGADIILNGFGDATEIDDAKRAIESEFGVKARYNGADMTQPEAIASMISAAEEMGGVDILVNNAGIQHTAPVEEFPPSKWDAIIAINLSSVFHASRAVLPSMRKKGWGRIINTASAHGLVASPEKSAYVAAKHGVIGLTKVIALETAGSGITCNAICPGWVRTPLVEKQIEKIAEEEGISIDEAAGRLLGGKQPSKAFATPEQIGAFAVFLSGSAADQITGASLPIDGGWTAQ